MFLIVETQSKIESTIRFALSLNADVNFRDNFGLTAFYAAEEAFAAGLRLILQTGKFDFQKNSEKETVLFESINGDINIFNEVIDAPNFDPNEFYGTYGNIYLQSFGSSPNLFSVIQRLIQTP